MRSHRCHSAIRIRQLAGHCWTERDERPRRLKVAGLLALLTLACSETSGDPTGPGVTVGGDALPAVGAAYHGVAPHQFLGGSAQLFCSVHGGFTSAVSPPASQGGTVRSDYFATFQGQLVLAPPAVAATVTHPLSVQVHMVEQITLAGTQGTLRTFDTELVTFELGGPTAPGGVMVRESSSTASTGSTTISTLADGQYHIESLYDVWLEISLDGGATWNPAAEAVRMTLGPPPS